MPKNSTILFAFILLVLGNLFATFVDVIVKLLATDVSIYQYIFLRQLAVLALMFPLWLKLPEASKQRGNNKVYAARAILTNIGAPSAVVALLYLPLATANVIFYSAPLFTIILATILLKEKIKIHRVAVTLMGFIGVAVALRPEYFGIAGLLAVCTALAVAGYNLSVKWLPKNSSTINTIFWSNLFTIPLTGIIALFNWQPITFDMILLSVGSCVCLIIYQGCSIMAFQKADAGAITVAEYSGLIFAAALGWLLFSEPLDLWTVFGITLIIVPITWQSWFEHRQEKAIMV
ncbi:DMT family transporter [Aliikangiella coralliicola]|uniref:DMT family transporter n=1 Tax=Aliikangiella coralliicola TaxID=2592383 RepID=A0A545U6J0_9GAMM|nr:DMT family transporter [Aliikangiella coralliicola]TQV85077.1 DMT family transporter [Aliikangiella coralliicola]